MCIRDRYRRLLIYVRIRWQYRIKNGAENKVADPGFRALGFCVQPLYGGDWRPEERENGKRAGK